jgi:hypothetical protein
MSASPQVSLYFRQQRRQGAMTMVARDLIVQRAEDALDGIGLGTTPVLSWSSGEDPGMAQIVVKDLQLDRVPKSAPRP